MSLVDSVPAPATSPESRNPYTPGTLLHAIVHEALTGEEILPGGDPRENERWTLAETALQLTPEIPESTTRQAATSELATVAPDGPSHEALEKAREILERVAAMPHRFDSLEVMGPGLGTGEDRHFGVLAIFHELRIDSRYKILPQVVRQLLALSAVAVELADAIADGDPDQAATRLDWMKQTRSMIDSRIYALQSRRNTVVEIIKKITGHGRRAW